MNNLKKFFPLLSKNKVVYLDSAATSQRPKCVIDAVKRYYQTTNANAHRGVYKLSASSTEQLNKARKVVKNFLNAKHEDEIVFAKNATECLNLVAYSYGLENLKEGDEVVLSVLEHHSNIVPWQEVCKKTKSTVKFLHINKNFEIDNRELQKISPKTKVVGICSVSNVLGTQNDIKKIVEIAHQNGAVVVADLSQSVAHEMFDVQKFDVDFAVFGGHKMYAPFGIGVLFGKKELLEKMPPFLAGGDMIEYVFEDHTTFAPVPNKFEAGTQNVASAVGLMTAIEFLNKVGFEKIQEIETSVTNFALAELKKLPFVKVYAPKNAKNVISFNMVGVHSHDVASLLDEENICVRSGNHCAQPLLRSLGLEATVRLSVAMYNSKEDIIKLIDALKKIYNKFKNFL